MTHTPIAQPPASNPPAAQATLTPAAGGSITLTAEQGPLAMQGGARIAANGVTGGQILLQARAARVTVEGQLEARGTAPTTGGAAEPDPNARGGSIQVLGQEVVLTGQAAVDASGDAGGGTILIGGDYQGKTAEIQNALRTYVGQDVVLKADALLKGDGGKVIVWADEATHFVGSISAIGGAQPVARLKLTYIDPQTGGPTTQYFYATSANGFSGGSLKTANLKTVAVGTRNAALVGT